MGEVETILNCKGTKIFILVVIPFLVSLVWFPSSVELSRIEENIHHKETEMVEGNSIQKITNIKGNAIKTLFGKLLGIDYFIGNYKICFRDEGGIVTYKDEESEWLGYTWNVNFNDESNLAIKPKSVGCADRFINYNENLTYRWAAQFHITDFSSNYPKEKAIETSPVLYLSAVTYIKPYWVELWVQRIILILGLWQILWLITRIIKIFKSDWFS